MGIHHYQLEVIPNSFWKKNGTECISGSELQEGLTPWVNIDPPSSLFIDSLRTLLPLNKSWGEVEEYTSSNDWGSDIRIWRQAGAIENIQFRFSPIADDWSLMQRFLGLVKSEGLVLLECESGYFLEPDEQAIRGSIMTSKACKFALNPKQTLIESASDLNRNTANIDKA